MRIESAYKPQSKSAPYEPPKDLSDRLTALRRTRKSLQFYLFCLSNCRFQLLDTPRKLSGVNSSKPAARRGEQKFPIRYRCNFGWLASPWAASSLAVGGKLC